MAFKGDLDNLSLFDVFQTLNQNQQTGVLVLQREGASKKLYISPEGVRIIFTRTFRPLRLGEIFVRRGRLSPQDVEILLLEQKREYRPIGRLLVESGKVPQEEVDQVLRYHAEDEILEIFSWTSGTFAFYDGQEVTASSTPLSDVLMDPAGLCLEAARRLDEIQRLRERIQTNDESFVAVDGMDIDRAESEVALCAVFDALKEPCSVNELRDIVGLSLLDTLSALEQLLDVELIRPLTIEELIQASQRERESGEYENAARLLEIAHCREPSNREILEACVEAIQRLGEPRRLARFLAQLGMLLLEAGRHDDAVEQFEQALRANPTDLDALVGLRDAYAELGDVERTADVSLKLARAHSESADLQGAINACRTGLEVAPQSIALRYYLGQLLVRAEEGGEAQHILYKLIRDTEQAHTRGYTEKAHELLTNCYRLLLKVDPSDEEAALGLREVDRKRMSSLRRRRIVLRSAIAMAVLAMAGTVGIVMQGSSASEYLDRIVAAHRSRDTATVLELTGELLEEYPDSPEAAQASRIRREVQKERAAARNARLKREKTLRAEMEERNAELRAALNDRPYLEALDAVRLYCLRLNSKEMRFLRKDAQLNAEYAFGSFLDRVLEIYKADRQLVQSSPHQLRALSADDATDGLRELESRLESVRGRDWIRLVPEMESRLGELRKESLLKGTLSQVDAFLREMRGVKPAFTDLDSLYFAVKSARLESEIDAAVDRANREGREHLRNCRFAEARELYETAFRLADAIADQEPRVYFRDLLERIAQRSLLHRMASERDRITQIEATLAEVQRRLERNEADVAYRLMRDLVWEHKQIKFELRFDLPYHVDSTPKGAEVRVDGEKAGATPCTIRLPISGNRRVLIRVSREGFDPEERRLLPIDEKLDGTLLVSLRKRLAWDREVSGAVEARPVIEGKLLLVATSNANLLAFDLERGELAWEAPTRRLDRVRAAPVVQGDHAWLLTVSGRMFRVRLADGVIDGEPLRLGGRIEQDAVLADGTLYVATRKPSLAAVRDGRVIYEKPLAHVSTTELAYAGGRIYAGTAENGTVLVHDAATGEEVSRLRAPSGTSFFGGLAVQSGLLLAGAEDGNLYAFRLVDGKRAWEYRTPGPVTAPASGHGKCIYLPTRDGWVHSLDPEGNLHASYEIGNAVEASPGTAGEFLYAISMHRVVAFDTEKGQEWWRHVFARERAVHLVVGGGRIVVLTDRPWIYAFPADTR